MKRSSTDPRFQSFNSLRKQASLVSKGHGPPTLWIACTDTTMDPVLERIAEGGAVLFLRQAKFEIPAGQAEIRNELSAINFAVERLGVNEIVVCGHSLCSCFSRSRPKADRLSPVGGLDLLRRGVIQRQAMNDRLRKHVIHQLRVLESYPSVKHASQSGRLRIYGLFYLAESGVFSCYDSPSSRFTSCDEAPES